LVNMNSGRGITKILANDCDHPSNVEKMHKRVRRDSNGNPCEGPTPKTASAR